MNVSYHETKWPSCSAHGFFSLWQTELLPDLAFFTKEQASEFVKGKKYKKLKLDMKKGMRTCAAAHRVLASRGASHIHRR